MLQNVLLFISQAIFSLCEFWVFEDLPDLQQNLTAIYEHVDKFNFSILLETAVGYYDELKELTYAVDYKDHEAEVMLRNIFDEGGPLHAYDPPYKQFTRCYDWTDREKEGFEDLMNKTCRVWNALKVKVKEPEYLESESSGNF